MNNPLITLIKDIVDAAIIHYHKGQPRFWTVKVVASSGTIAQDSMASVYVNSDPTSTPISLKNKSNQSLTANVEAIALSPSGSLSDAVILIKK